jgi:hypothetical protein
MNLQETVKINLFGRDYEVSYPNVGQFLDIENRKAMMTQGRYVQMVQNNTTSSKFALDLVDALSTFLVLAPGAFTGMQVSLESMDLVTAKEITQQYVDVYYPFYNELERLLSEATDNTSEQLKEVKSKQVSS